VSADAGGVYITVQQHGEGAAVYYVDDATGQSHPIASALSVALDGSSSVLDDSYVYWVEGDFETSDPGALYRAPRCGCP
jgi:hypothetical protein